MCNIKFKFCVQNLLIMALLLLCIIIIIKYNSALLALNIKTHLNNRVTISVSNGKLQPFLGHKMWVTDF